LSLRELCGTLCVRCIKFVLFGLVSVEISLSKLA
jgi:hypothetical protein